MRTLLDTECWFYHKSHNLTQDEPRVQMLLETKLHNFYPFIVTFNIVEHLNTTPKTCLNPEHH